MSKKKSKATSKDSSKASSAEVEASNGPGDRRPTLERRRDELQARTSAVQAAELELTRLEQDMENNTIATRQQESAMEAATARVTDLEQALKNSGKQRKELRSALKQARSDAEQARESAVAAEAKYEKAVLKEVVRREKVVDLTVHGG